MIDLLVIGAGPAGLATTAEAAAAGLSVVLVDENAAPGGQIYRGLEGADPARVALLGKAYRAGRPLIEAMRRAPATLMLHTTVWSIERRDEGYRVGVAEAGAGGQRRMQELAARRVLIATGALERPFPIPGWALPGVMTAGAAQTLLKASGAVPEGPTVIAGSGPLLFLLAAQYRRAGVPIDRLLLTTPAANLGAALPRAAAFLASPYAGKGLGLLAGLAGRVRMVRGVTGLAAEGDGALRAVSYVAGGREHHVPARTLLLHQGVVPQASLAMAAGCEHGWNPERLAFEPARDAFGESSVPGLYIAGDCAGIGGAEAAALEGRIAARRIATALAGATEADPKTVALRRNLRHALRGRAFLDRLYRPPDALRVPEGDVLVCRCESVTAATVRAACARGATGPNQVKAFTRAGMGPCQGRLCGLTVSEIVAEATGQPMEAVGHSRLRFPSKPVTLGELATLHAPPQGGRSRHGRLF